MARILLIGVNAAVLSLGCLLLAVLSGAYTPEGLPRQPSRVGAALVFMRLMPFEASTFLPLLQHLVWAPVVSVLGGLFAAVPALRSLRWMICAANVAALAYLYIKLPGMASPRTLPLFLQFAAGLLVAGVVLPLMIPRRAAPGAAGKLASFFLALLCLSAVAILAYGAWLRPPQARALAVTAGCVVGYLLAFYCLGKAAAGSGRTSALMLLPMGMTGMALVWAPPMALPIIAGIILLTAPHVR